MRIVYEGKKAGATPKRALTVSGGGLSATYHFAPLEVQDVSEADGALLLALAPAHGRFRHPDAPQTLPSVPAAEPEPEPTTADAPTADDGEPEAVGEADTGEGDADTPIDTEGASGLADDVSAPDVGERPTAANHQAQPQFGQPGSSRRGRRGRGGRDG